MPAANKTTDAHPDFRVLTKGTEINAGWIKKGDTSGKHYVSLSPAAPEFGSKILCANLNKAAGEDNGCLFAVICNSVD